MSARIASQSEPIPGYRLIERIGRGGFGEVWKCEAPGGLLKAIKFVFGDLETAGDENKPAEQELKALSRVKSIRHPYILSLERFDIVDGQLVIVMELADRNLWDRFRECRNAGLPGVPREELLRYLEETAEALDLMISQYGLQHLDIKPQNLFLVHNHVKVADFGLAKDLEGARATVTGGVTPVYAAPETFEGWVSRFCDQYSLAIVYQEMLTGVRPFNGRSTRELLLQHLQADPDLSPLPPGEREAIARALSKTPDDRWPTCTEFVRRIRTAGAEAAGAVALPVPTYFPPPGDSRPTSTQPLPPPSSGRSLPTGGSGILPPLTQRPIGQPPLTQLSPLPPLTLPRPVTLQGGLSGIHSRPAPREETGPGVLRPGLVVGVGGLGLAVLRQFRKAVAERWGRLDALPNLRTVFIDTDAEEIQAAAEHPDRDLALSNREWALARLNRPKHYLQNESARFDRWLNPQLLHRMPRTPATMGFRSFGRLGLLDNYRAVATRLRQELEAALDPTALQTAARTGLTLRTNRPVVYLAAGLGGGTGSGMFLDLAYLLKSQLRALGYAKPEVVGLLLLPPVERGGRQQCVANAFAALTELAHFSSPRTVYDVKFDPKDAPVHDAERPFARCALVGLPKAPDARETARATGMAAALAARELLTPLGRVTDERRAEYYASFPAEGACCQSFGLFRLAAPRGSLRRCSVRRFVQHLLDRWALKEASHLRQPVADWLADQLARRGLLPESVVARLRNAAEAELGGAPEALFDAHADSLAGPAAAGRLSADAAVVTLDKLLRLVGRPDETEDDHRFRGQLEDRLQAEARAAVAEADRHLTDLSVFFVEQPGYRLAAAEEVVRQLTERTAEVSKGFEQLVRTLDAEAYETFARLMGLIGGLKGGGSRQAAAEVLKLLREYPRKRLLALQNNAVLLVFRSMAGALPELLRELNFARQRLTDLAGRVAALPKTWSSSALGPGRLLLPAGCRTLEDAADNLIAHVPPDALREFEERVQAQVRRQFGGLIHVCVDTNDATEPLRELLEQAAETFMGSQVHERDAADAFFECHAEQEARREILEAFEEAIPELAGPRARPEAQLCVLSAPPTSAGQRFRELAADALPDHELVAVDAPDDLAFYREQRQVSLADLPQLGPLALDAAQQVMNAEQVSPFCRTDIHWLPAGGE